MVEGLREREKGMGENSWEKWRNSDGFSDAGDGADEGVVRAVRINPDSDEGSIGFHDQEAREFSRGREPKGGRRDSADGSIKDGRRESDCVGGKGNP
jgi:hypothetical protein